MLTNNYIVVLSVKLDNTLGIWSVDRIKPLASITAFIPPKVPGYVCVDRVTSLYKAEFNGNVR
jgi:hypothetical protein